jgi:hypothetical protein
VAKTKKNTAKEPKTVQARKNLVFLFFMVSWGARKHAYQYPSTSGGNRAALGPTKLDSLIGSVERLVGLDLARKR